MKSFEFEDPDMQEHFNSNYAQSDHYPKAFFKGFIRNLSSINFEKDSTYKAEIEGALTIHGVTKVIKQTGTFKIKNGRVIGKAEFYIVLSDFDIKIPQAVINNISNNIDIIVDVILDKQPMPMADTE